MSSIEDFEEWAYERYARNTVIDTVRTEGPWKENSKEEVIFFYILGEREVARW
jgi:hypothetical protein